MSDVLPESISALRWSLNQREKVCTKYYLTNKPMVYIM